MKPVIEYYLDEKCTKRLPVTITGGAIVDWGESVPGVSKERILYVKNLTNDSITLRQPHTEDADLRIADFPPRLQRNDSGMVKLEFSPHSNRITPLNAAWSFDLVIG